MRRRAEATVSLHRTSYLFSRPPRGRRFGQRSWRQCVRLRMSLILIASAGAVLGNGVRWHCRRTSAHVPLGLGGLRSPPPARGAGVAETTTPLFGRRAPPARTAHKRFRTTAEALPLSLSRSLGLLEGFGKKSHFSAVAVASFFSPAPSCAGGARRSRKHEGVICFSFQVV